MINKTKNYDLFKFRDDNREKIDQIHVKRLSESIASRNLLELRPIVVNEKMEILDGQHRLLAAKLLGVEIYYQQEKKLEASDIIRMNITKQWSMSDYMNFHCHHMKKDYLMLRRFMQDHQISLHVAITIVIGEGKTAMHNFKIGDFVYNHENLDFEIEVCKETIEYIKKMNGHCTYVNAARFWKALIKLIRHPDFKVDRWRTNYQKLIDHFSIKGSFKDYIIMISKIYNWRNPSTISLLDDEL